MGVTLLHPQKLNARATAVKRNSPAYKGAQMLNLIMGLRCKANGARGTVRQEADGLWEDWEGKQPGQPGAG